MGCTAITVTEAAIVPPQLKTVDWGFALYDPELKKCVPVGSACSLDLANVSQKNLAVYCDFQLIDIPTAGINAEWAATFLHPDGRRSTWRWTDSYGPELVGDTYRIWKQDLNALYQKGTYQSLLIGASISLR